MLNWRTQTSDPCDPDAQRSVHEFLLQRRSCYPGRLIDFFVQACKGKSVLHLGFVEHSVSYVGRPGWKHAAIARVARRAVGVDVAADGIEAAKRMGYEVHSLDITGPRSLDEIFDLVLAGDIAEHLMSLDSIYRFAIRHMGPRSLLLMSTPNPTCLLWMLGTLRGRTYVTNLEHTCWISPSQVNEHATRVGMEFDHYFPIMGGANLGPIARALKARAFRWFPELVASTNVFQLKLPAQERSQQSQRLTGHESLAR